MHIDQKVLQRFEQGLDPNDLNRSSIPAKTLGYGEISSIFQIGDMDLIAFKRMPLFSQPAEAENYAEKYRQYCGYLKEAGLNLPEDDTRIISCPGHPVALYIAQRKYPADLFVHRLIHTMQEKELLVLLTKIISSINKIWEFNQANASEKELSLDGQISNWIWSNSQLYYVDTSTPMFRLQGHEQLNPELLLQSAPGFLRWILRLFFLKDVMNRYYDLRLVYIDLVANLYKEQCPNLIPDALRIINLNIPEGIKPLSQKEVEKYYREDKMIWTLFLAFRRIDRAIITKVLKKRYEFILPGSIKR